jgi:uncharacterized RDD family membrane protein YckC
VSSDDNPYGLPPAGYAPAPPQPPSPFANPYAPAGYAPPPGPPPMGHGFNPYAPPSAAAQGPGWAQGFGLTQELASLGSRFVAKLLDGLLYFGVVLVIGLPSTAFGFDEFGAGLVALTWIGLAIYQWVLIATTGQTLGKKWMGIRIVKLDGSPVDFVSGVLLRIWALYGLTCVGSLIMIGGLLPLVDALMIFGDERRCLHDHLASTKVIVA